jgi:hypothetical protein
MDLDFDDALPECCLVIVPSEYVISFVIAHPFVLGVLR